MELKHYCGSIINKFMHQEFKPSNHLLAKLADDDRTIKRLRAGIEKYRASESAEIKKLEAKRDAAYRVLRIATTALCRRSRLLPRRLERMNHSLGRRYEQIKQREHHRLIRAAAAQFAIKMQKSGYPLA